MMVLVCGEHGGSDRGRNGANRRAGGRADGTTQQKTGSAANGGPTHDLLRGRTPRHSGRKHDQSH